MKNVLTLLFTTTLLIKVVGFNVIGYLPSYRFHTINSIDFSKLTHVMVFFVNPDVSGVFSFSEDISEVVDAVQPYDCKVFISIGGGGLSESIENTYETKTEVDNRSEFIHNLLEFARENKVDGIDVDLEGLMVQMPTYDGFIQELIDSAHYSNFAVSAALAKWTGGSVNNSTVEMLDFLNLMSYDLTGPWTSEGQHSPLSQSQGDFNFWQQKGASRENLMIGLPFYGYEFKEDETVAWTWCQIVSDYPDSLSQDKINTGKGDLYFNGKATIEDKLQFAKTNEAGGVMIWELGQDCFDQHSLLDLIDEKVQELIGFEEVQSVTQVFPNPTNGFLTIEGSNYFEFKLFDSFGKQVFEGFGSSSVIIDLTSFNYGLYIISIESEFYTSTFRLVKN